MLTSLAMRVAKQAAAGGSTGMFAAAALLGRVATQGGRLSPLTESMEPVGSSMLSQLRCLATPSSTKATASSSSPAAAGPVSPASSKPSASPENHSSTDAASADSSGDRSQVSYGARKVTRLTRAEQLAAEEGVVCVKNTFNNILLTLTDKAGNVKTWTTAASVGFRNARKSQPVAAEKAADELAKRAMKMGYGSVIVKLNGVGSNKQYAVQALHAAGLKITQLMDVTPVPYNGCRPPAKRRT